MVNELLDRIRGQTHFQDIAKGELDLGSQESEEEKQKQEATEKQAEPLLKRLKDELKDDVQDVRVTTD